MSKNPNASSNNSYRGKANNRGGGTSNRGGKPQSNTPSSRGGKPNFDNINSTSSNTNTTPAAAAAAAEASSTTPVTTVTPVATTTTTQQQQQQQQTPVTTNTTTTTAPDSNSAAASKTTPPATNVHPQQQQPLPANAQRPAAAAAAAGPIPSVNPSLMKPHMVPQRVRSAPPDEAHVPINVPVKHNFPAAPAHLGAAGPAAAGPLGGPHPGGFEGPTGGPHPSGGIPPHAAAGGIPPYGYGAPPQYMAAPGPYGPGVPPPHQPWGPAPGAPNHMPPYQPPYYNTQFGGYPRGGMAGGPVGAGGAATTTTRPAEKKRSHALQIVDPATRKAVDLTADTKSTATTTTTTTSTTLAAEKPAETTQQQPQQQQQQQQQPTADAKPAEAAPQQPQQPTETTTTKQPAATTPEAPETAENKPTAENKEEKLEEAEKPTPSTTSTDTTGAPAAPAPAAEKPAENATVEEETPNPQENGKKEEEEETSAAADENKPTPASAAAAPAAASESSSNQSDTTSTSTTTTTTTPTPTPATAGSRLGALRPTSVKFTPSTTPAVKEGQQTPSTPSGADRTEGPNPPKSPSSKRIYDREYLLMFRNLCTEAPAALKQQEIYAGEGAPGPQPAIGSPFPGGGKRGGKGFQGGQFQGQQGGPMGQQQWPRGGGQFPFAKGQRGGAGGHFPGKGGRGGHMQNQPPLTKNYLGETIAPVNLNAPLQKSENAWTPGQIADEKDKILKKVKGILNKITPEKYEKLRDQILELDMTLDGALVGVIDCIFEKAISEPNFSTMYATLCADISKSDKIMAMQDTAQQQHQQQDAAAPPAKPYKPGEMFRKILLSRCQEEFEKENALEQFLSGDKEMTEAEKEEALFKARRRMTGNIKFVGELFKQKMLSEKIMHEVIKKLLSKPVPAEEEIEVLCKLLTTVGKLIDHEKAQPWMNQYFKKMTELSQNQALSSRIRFMLLDVIDLRKEHWVPRRSELQAKKISEIKTDLQQEQVKAARDLNIRPPGGTRGGPQQYPQGGGARGGGRGGYQGGPGGKQFQQFNKPQQQQQQQQQQADAAGWSTVGGPQKTAGGQRGGGGGPQGGGPGGMRRTPSEEQFTKGGRGGYGGDGRGAFGGRAMGGGVGGAGAPGGGGAGAGGGAEAGKPANLFSALLQSGSSDEEETGAEGEEEEITFRPTGSGLSLGAAKAAPAAKQDKGAGGPKKGSKQQQQQQQQQQRGGPRRAGAPSEQEEAPSVAARRREEEEVAKAAASGAPGLTAEQVDEEVTKNFEEYCSVGDKFEVAERTRELKAPQFHGEMVAAYLNKSFDRDQRTMDNIATLFSYLKREEVFSAEDFVRGFSLALENIVEGGLDADIPKVYDYLGHFFARALADNLLSLETVDSVILRPYAEQDRISPRKMSSMLAVMFTSLKKEVNLLKPRNNNNNNSFAVEHITKLCCNAAGFDVFHLLNVGTAHEQLLDFFNRMDREGLISCDPNWQLYTSTGTSISGKAAGDEHGDGNGGNGGDDDAPLLVKKWIEENVPAKVAQSEQFARKITSGVVSSVTLRTTLSQRNGSQDPTSAAELIKQEQQLLAKYASTVLKRFVTKRRNHQLAALFELQYFCYAARFPQDLMNRLFECLYREQVIQGEVFIDWKDDTSALSTSTPGKQEALIKSQRFMNDLQNALAEQEREEEEEEEEEDHHHHHQ